MRAAPLPAITARRYTGSRALGSSQGKELWRTLAMALLAMAAVETVFVVWVGRER